MDRSTVVPVVILALGVGGVLSPLAAYSVHDTHHHVQVDRDGDATVSPIASVVAFEDLSETEKEAVNLDRRVVVTYEPARGEPPTHRHDVFSPSAWERADGLQGSEYVRFEGGYYAVDVEPFVATSRGSLGALATLIGVPLGALLLVVGASMWAAGSLRALTFRRALGAVLAVGFGLLVVEALFRVTFAPHPSILLSDGAAVLGAVSLLAVGAALATRDRWGVAGTAALVLALVAYQSAGVPYPFWRILGGVLGFGVPFLALGYALTPATLKTTADGADTGVTRHRDGR